MSFNIAQPKKRSRLQRAVTQSVKKRKFTLSDTDSSSDDESIGTDLSIAKARSTTSTDVSTIKRRSTVPASASNKKTDAKTKGSASSTNKLTQTNIFSWLTTKSNAARLDLKTVPRSHSKTEEVPLMYQLHHVHFLLDKMVMNGFIVESKKDECASSY